MRWALTQQEQDPLLRVSLFTSTILRTRTPSGSKDSLSLVMEHWPRFSIMKSGTTFIGRSAPFTRGKKMWRMIGAAGSGEISVESTIGMLIRFCGFWLVSLFLLRSGPRQERLKRNRLVK